MITKLLAGLLALAAVAGFAVISVHSDGNASGEDPAPTSTVDHPGGDPAANRCPPPRVEAAIPYWDQPRAVASFRSHVGAIDSITLFWYFLRSDGEVERYRYAEIDRDLLRYAREHNVTTYALIANLPGAPEPEGEWDWRRVQRAIGNPESRHRHVSEIVALVEDLGVDGVNIDYEGLQEHQTDEFTAFIELLAAELHGLGKRLAISVFVQEPDDDDNHGQDLLALGKAADELVVMAYDEHYDESRPGPVASIGWVAEGLRSTAELGVPDDRVVLGVPLYGYLWPERGRRARSLVHDEVAALLRQEGASASFDEEADSPHARVDAGTVWFEDARSAEAKIRLARDSGVRRLYFWRLGGEDPAVWDVLARLNGECR
ncbi:MAG: glycosyl hydrolase family 18 protein [Acidimicrobiia bacterium]